MAWLVAAVVTGLFACFVAIVLTLREWARRSLAAGGLGPVTLAHGSLLGCAAETLRLIRFGPKLLLSAPLLALMLLCGTDPLSLLSDDEFREAKRRPDASHRAGDDGDGRWG